MEKKNLTLIIVSIVFVVFIGTVSLFLGVNALENDNVLIEKEKCIELEPEVNQELAEEDSEYIFYEGFDVMVTKVDTKEERKAVEIAKELYEYGNEALFCGKFEYGIETDNGYEIKNFEEVIAKFTKDNLVDALPGGEDFNSFYKTMDVKEVNGKYYTTNDCARGSHLGYRGTILTLISYNDIEIKMEATSIYFDEEIDDISYMETETDEFIVRKEDNEWKIAKITANN